MARLIRQVPGRTPLVRRLETLLIHRVLQPREPLAMPDGSKPSGGSRHDAAYKSLFSRSRTVADTLRLKARDLVADLDLDTLERVPASFVSDTLAQRHVDMLWRVRTRRREWLYVIVLIEFQSTVDRRMPLRMLDYTVRALMALDDDELGPGGSLPAVLPIVIHSGDRRWNAALDVRGMFASVPERFLGFLPQHRYLLIDLQAPGSYGPPTDNVLSMIAELERAGSRERLEELAALLPELAARVQDPLLMKWLVTWIELVRAWKVSPDGREPHINFKRMEEEEMSTLLDRALEWNKEVNQEWLERGRQEGIKREIGLLLRFVAGKFGATVADRIAPALEALKDPEDIETVADTVLECTTAEEFLARANGLGQRPPGA